MVGILLQCTKSFDESSMRNVLNPLFDRIQFASLCCTFESTIPFIQTQTQTWSEKKIQLGGQTSQYMVRLECSMQTKRNQTNGFGHCTVNNNVFLLLLDIERKSWRKSSQVNRLK